MTANETRLVVQIQPNAKRNEVISFTENILHLKIAAPPVEGKANRELIVFLSKILDVPKSNIVVEKGATSRRKNLLFKGILPAKLQEFTAQFGKKVDGQKRLL